MYQLELLHPDWFARRPYRTYAGLYASLDAAQASVSCNGRWWIRKELVIGKYRYPMWELAVGKSGAWWRITKDRAISSQTSPNSSAV